MHAFQRKLIKRKEEGSLRSLSLLSSLADFYSNDYLSMAQPKRVNQSFSGSTGSRLLSGNSETAENTERFLAEFFESEAALVFNSGYDANVGLLSSVPQRGDTILFDSLVHASARDGIRLSQAKAFSFRHNDLEDLHRLLEKAEGSIFVVVESLYSMDGDFAPLVDIINLCDKFQALLIVDEAHSGGIFGQDGKGLCAEFEISSRIFARLITFGKAYGTHGAAILGSSELIQFLINFSRSFIYTTALPSEQYKHIQQQIQQVAEEKKQIQLQQKVQLFRSSVSSVKCLSDARSPIQIIPISGVEACRKSATLLQEQGFAVKPILSPTVAEGSERLRICLHLHNSDESILQLANEIEKMLPKIGK